MYDRYRYRYGVDQTPTGGPVPHDPAPIAPHECWRCRIVVCQGEDGAGHNPLWGELIRILGDPHGGEQQAKEYVDTEMAALHQTHKRSWI